MGNPLSPLPEVRNKNSTAPKRLSLFPHVRPTPSASFPLPHRVSPPFLFRRRPDQTRLPSLDKDQKAPASGAQQATSREQVIFERQRGKSQGIRGHRCGRQRVSSREWRSRFSRSCGLGKAFSDTVAVAGSKAQKLAELVLSFFPSFVYLFFFSFESEPVLGRGWDADSSSLQDPPSVERKRARVPFFGRTGSGGKSSISRITISP